MSSKFEVDWMKYVGVTANRMWVASEPNFGAHQKPRPLTYRATEHKLYSARSEDVGYQIWSMSGESFWTS